MLLLTRQLSGQIRVYRLALARRCGAVEMPLMESTCLIVMRRLSIHEAPAKLSRIGLYSLILHSKSIPRLPPALDQGNAETIGRALAL
jgi:hypothetical protein